MRLTATQIRLWNARYLADQDGSIADFAARLNKSQTQAGNLIGINPKRNIGNKIAREIEQAYNKPEGWLDEAHHDLWYRIERPEWHDDLPVTGVNEPRVDYTIIDESAPLTIDPDQRALNEAWKVMSQEDRNQLLALAKRLSGMKQTPKQDITIDASKIQGESDELKGKQTKKKAER